jgi:hypothetical protein
MRRRVAKLDYQPAPPRPARMTLIMLVYIVVACVAVGPVGGTSWRIASGHNPDQGAIMFLLLGAIVGAMILMALCAEPVRLLPTRSRALDCLIAAGAGLLAPTTGVLIAMALF